MSESEKVEALYADILDRGGIVSVVREMFGDGIAGLEINGFGSGQNYTHIRAGQRASQVFLSLEERCFLFDFWEDERKLASGSSANLQDLKASVARWLSKVGSIDDLEETFSFVSKK